MKNSIKELTEGMQRLCAVANRIVAANGEVARIEIDLLQDSLRHLYDTSFRLAEERGQKVATPKEEHASESPMPDAEMLSSTVMATMAAMTVATPVTPQEVVPAPEPIVAPEPEAKSVIEPVEEPAVEPIVEPAVEPVIEPVVEPVVEPAPIPRIEEIEANDNSLLFDEIVIEPEPEPEPTPTPEPELAAEPRPAGSQASLLDYLKRPVEEQPTVRTLGDTLNAEAEQRQSTPLQQQLEKKVSDLRTVININDKFSFMNELFHSNMKAYNDFILRLNAIDNRDEALVAMNEVAAQYRWDDNSLAVKTFHSIFDKKF